MRRLAKMLNLIKDKGNAISNEVQRGHFGYSIKYGDLTSLAATLKEILNDNCLARTLGNNGRRYVFEKRDWVDIVDALEEVYQEVVRKPNHKKCCG